MAGGGASRSSTRASGGGGDDGGGTNRLDLRTLAGFLLPTASLVLEPDYKRTKPITHEVAFSDLIRVEGTYRFEGLSFA